MVVETLNGGAYETPSERSDATNPFLPPLRVPIHETLPVGLA